MRVNTISFAVFCYSAPLLRTVLCRTVANGLSMGFEVRKWPQCWAGNSKTASVALRSLVRLATPFSYLTPYFSEKTVSAVSASARVSACWISSRSDFTAVSIAEMVAATQLNSGIPAIQMSFEEFAWGHQFDGIWACASLLHVKRTLPVREAKPNLRRPTRGVNTVFRVTVLTQRSAPHRVTPSALRVFANTLVTLTYPSLAVMSLFIFDVGPFPGEPFQRHAEGEIYTGILRPLCWAGLLDEHRSRGAGLAAHTYQKAALWPLLFALQTDGRVRPAVRH